MGAMVSLAAKNTHLRADDKFAEICDGCDTVMKLERYTIGRLGGYGRCNICRRVFPMECLGMVSLDSMLNKLEAIHAGSH